MVPLCPTVCGPVASTIVPPEAFAAAAFLSDLEAGTPVDFGNPLVAFTLNEESELFTLEPVGGLFTYVGPVPQPFLILGRGSFAIRAESPDFTLSMRIGLGTPLVAVSAPGVVDISAAVAHVTTGMILTLSPGDTIGLLLESDNPVAQMNAFSIGISVGTV